MRLYFIRHGESEANLLNEISNRGRKHGLTAKGEAQVRALADELRAEDVRAIFASPLLRAEQSAEILAGPLGLPFQTTPALSEYDMGVLEGRSDQEAWRAYKTLLHDWVLRGDWDARVEGGESINDIRARFVLFVKRLRAEYTETGGALLLVGHGGLYRCMLPLVLDGISFEFALEHTVGNADYVLAEPNGPHLVCRRWSNAL